VFLLFGKLGFWISGFVSLRTVFSIGEEFMITELL